MTFEEAEEIFSKVSEIDDVGEKRFRMFRAFEQVLDELGKDSVKDLNGFDGYMYKMSQDFLVSSSTYEKEQKLEKILDYVEKKYVS